MNPSLAEASFFWSWLWPILLTVGYGIGVYYLIGFLRERLREPSEREPGPWAELRYHALGWPVIAVLVAIGALLLPLLWPIAWPRQNFLMMLGRVALIVMAALLTIQLISVMHFRAARGTWLRVRPLRRLAVGLVYGMAGLLVLEQFGFGLLPVWIVLAGAMLGLGLASKAPLGHLLAGAQLRLGRWATRGQALRLEDGTAGTIERIGWMQTTLRDAQGTTASVPNARITEGITRNDHLGSAGPRVELEVGLDPAGNLDRAEALALETLYELDNEQPSTGEADAPTAHYIALTRERAVLRVTFHVADLRDTAEARSIFLKAFNAALRQAGINLA